MYIDVHLFEYKDFSTGAYYNQCSGILSPPIEELISGDLQLNFPQDIVISTINGYKIHSNGHSIRVDTPDHASYAVRRVLFDKFFIEEAEKEKIKIHKFRVTDIDINNDFVMLYSEGMDLRADFVAGAFGLDDGGCKLFERATKYKQPNYLESIIIKYTCPKGQVLKDKNTIHAFLPKNKKIDFAGISPKEDHIVINIAAKKASKALMDEFLLSDEARAVLPPDFYESFDSLSYFKGRFPNGLARNFYGHRYVVLGDAAGLVRTFKGKGINSGIITGRAAAEVIVKNGVSREALHEYYYALRQIVNDIKYGKLTRYITLWSKSRGIFGEMLELAKDDPELKEAFYASVSGTKYYKQIFQLVLNKKTLIKLCRCWLYHFIPFKKQQKS
ncbi:MAG: NAD(P)/FAD-dependent oxidoreductase [Fibrobacteria bacterium]|nr:NAD(P)/FAD-dependent oxidoreductase [Fibrobacteria bacterium]